MMFNTVPAMTPDKDHQREGWLRRTAQTKGLVATKKDDQWIIWKGDKVLAETNRSGAERFITNYANGPDLTSYTLEEVRSIASSKGILVQTERDRRYRIRTRDGSKILLRNATAKAVKAFVTSYSPPVPA